jgi:hypothetical protein
VEKNMNTVLTIAASLLVGGAAAAQQSGSHDMSGMCMGIRPMSSMQHASPTSSATALHEAGQAAFAAIAEATTALESNAGTDWSKANIDALRQHLVDMDNVTVRSDVAKRDMPLGERYEITSANRKVRDSINQMVRLHASMANSEGPYHLAVNAIPAGIALTVTGSTLTDQTKIRGLGFFGLLTQGVHHQSHHLMLVEGERMDH